MNQLSDIAKSLPSQAVELSFDLPFKNHPPQGELHVYSAPLPNGVFILSSLQLPSIREDVLRTEEAFIHNFSSFLVSHLFYDPSIFQKGREVELIPTSVNGQPGLHFHITYIDNGNQKVINGVAVYSKKTLFHLFYITSKPNIEEMNTHYDKAQEQLASLI